jgi:hypothetical protein
LNFLSLELFQILNLNKSKKLAKNILFTDTKEINTFTTTQNTGEEERVKLARGVKGWNWGEGEDGRWVMEVMEREGWLGEDAAEIIRIKEKMVKK